MKQILDTLVVITVMECHVVENGEDKPLESLLFENSCSQIFSTDWMKWLKSLLI